MSRRPDAKTVKITEESLNKLKRVKEDYLNETSYSQSILKMWKGIEDTIKSKSNKSEMIEEETNESNPKDKTIVLSREAHLILNNIKYERNLKTISDAIEFICDHWESLNK